MVRTRFILRTSHPDINSYGSRTTTFISLALLFQTFYIPAHQEPEDRRPVAHGEVWQRQMSRRVEIAIVGEQKHLKAKSSRQFYSKIQPNESWNSD